MLGFRVIHGHASLNLEVCFLGLFVFDLVLLISNNIMRISLVILHEVEVGQKVGFY